MMYSIINKPNLRCNFRYLHDDTKVFIVSDVRYNDVRKTRYYTTKYDKVPEGAVLYACMSLHECQEISKSDKVGTAEPTVTTVKTLKHVSGMLQLPVLVLMSAECDLETKDVTYEAFLGRPCELLTT